MVLFEGSVGEEYRIYWYNFKEELFAFDHHDILNQYAIELKEAI